MIPVASKSRPRLLEEIGCYMSSESDTRDYSSSTLGGGGGGGGDLAAASDPPEHHVQNPGLFGPRFRNIWDTWTYPTLKNVFRMLRDKDDAPRDFAFRMLKGWGGWLSSNRDPTSEDFLSIFPPIPLDTRRLHEITALQDEGDGGICVTWLGHSSCLVQMNGVSFLTDPVFQERCSPLPAFGPKRVVPCPLNLATCSDAELPPLDFVVISHSHYDHLCKRTCREIHERYRGEVKFYVPLGLASWMRKNIGPDIQVKEMDWWQETEIEVKGVEEEDEEEDEEVRLRRRRRRAVRLVCLPAQHWSNRTPWDRDRTLWASWLVQGGGPKRGGHPEQQGCTPTQKFWFAGDTGYCPVFKEMGEKYGPFDVCAIPIGAYAPYWFMAPQHVDPRDAVRIHQDVGAPHTQSIAIHCATFALSREAMDEPPKLLENEMINQGLNPLKFSLLR